MELLDVEGLAELTRRLRLQLGDLELADLVGHGLARPRDVAVDLVLRSKSLRSRKWKYACLWADICTYVYTFICTNAYIRIYIYTSICT